MKQTRKPGGGRKAVPWQTKMVRVPLGCLAEVYLEIRKYKLAAKLDAKGMTLDDLPL